LLHVLAVLAAAAAVAASTAKVKAAAQGRSGSLDDGGQRPT